MAFNGSRVRTVHALEGSRGRVSSPGTPRSSSITLSPFYFEGEADWYLSATKVAAGVIVEKDGLVCFSPVPVEYRRETYEVVIEVQAVNAEGADFTIKLLWLGPDDRTHEDTSDHPLFVSSERRRLVFTIPGNKVGDTFACSFVVATGENPILIRRAEFRSGEN